MDLQKMIDGYVSPAEAARRLSVSSQWVIKLTKRGALPSLMTPLGRIIETRAVEQMARDRSKNAVM